MDSATLIVYAALVLEPFFVMAIAPRITRSFVKKDVDEIVAQKVAPHIDKAVRDATAPLLEALKKAAEAAQEMQVVQDEEPMSAAQEMAARSHDSRRDYALREEAFEAALVAKAGPVGLIIAEEAKARFRNHWRAFVRQGPDSVPQLLELAGKLGLKGVTQAQPSGGLNL